MTDIQDRLERIEAENDRLRERVDELEETVAVEDSAGRTVTLPTLESFGLTRRQALSAMALLTAGGYTLSGAIVETVRGASTSSGRYAAKAMQTREIRDENDNVAIDLPGGGGITVDLLNTADTSAAAQGEVLQKGSSGTDLTFGSVSGNIPNWQEDGNSPIDVSSVSSTQYTVNGSYDHILVIANPSNTGFSELQVNGDTGSNYDFHKEDGSTTTGASQWDLSFAKDRRAFGLIGPSGQINYWQEPAVFDLDAPQGGRNSNVSPPINTFTLKSASSRSTFARVYGLTL